VSSCDSLIKLLLDWGGEIIAALAGAFVGAGAAFLLQRRRENELKADAQYAAIIQAQHTLFFMWAILAEKKVKYLDRYRSDALGYRKLTLYPLPQSQIGLDFKSLGFLFRPTSRRVISDCFNAERSYLSAIEILKLRNEILTQIHALGGTVKESETGESQAVIPHDEIKDLKLSKATKLLYEAVDRGVLTCVSAFAGLRKAALEMFPNREFVEERNLSEEKLEKSAGQPSEQA
jgi:hypothetical protein